MRLKITSSGSANGTVIVDADTGQPVQNVRAIGWHVDVDRGIAVATFQTDLAEVDVIGQTDTRADAFDEIKRMLKG